MHKLSFPACLALALATSVAFAKPCIKVRSANDGYTCMKFSKSEKQKAQKLGVQFGNSYKSTQAQLAKAGWDLDQDWRIENSNEAKLGQPVCGHGLDAVCSISLRKGTVQIELIFSGASSEMPLIGIDSKL